MTEKTVIKSSKEVKNIHTKPLFNGETTAQEVHVKEGWRRRCGQCGNAPVIRIKTFMPLGDFVRLNPQLAADLKSLGKTPPIIKMKYGPMTPHGTEFACMYHKQELEARAAKLPSFVLVEIDEGPGPTEPIVAVQ